MDILLPVNSLSSVMSDGHNVCDSSVSLCVPVACQNSSTADLGFSGDDVSQKLVFDSPDVILPVSPSVDSSSQAIVDIDVPILQKSGIFKYWIAAKAPDLTPDSFCIEHDTVPVVSIKSHSDCSLHCQSNVDLSDSVFSHSQNSSHYIVKSGPTADDSCYFDPLICRRRVTFDTMNYFTLLVSSLLFSLVSVDYLALLIPAVECFDYSHFGQTGVLLFLLCVEVGQSFIQIVDFTRLLMRIVLSYLIKLDPL